MYIKIFIITYIVKIFRTVYDTNMSYFTVNQIIEFAFSGKLAYSLPETVKNMLVELESCLDITDVEPNERERKDYKSSDSKRTSTTETTVKYRNRYDYESPQIGRGEKEKDGKKKRDFRSKDNASAEWRSGGVVVKEESVDAEWELMRSFKPTKIESKTGIDKRLNDIRIALNKISAANYEKQRDAIFGLVNGYFESEEEKTTANTKRISKTIFEIASTNKFYSEMYAKLYKELVDAHSVFYELLEELIAGFIAMDTIPVYVDPDTDYDGFCAYSKACEIRKSTTTFIVNCFKLGIITDSSVMDILSEFVKFVKDKRTDSSFTKNVEEVVENIYIIATMCIAELTKNAKWCEYALPTIRQFVADKSNDFPGMSNRAVFKLMDVVDKL
jgi:hypothetical protein